jgi:two-component system NarL family sensor kinase
VHPANERSQAAAFEAAQVAYLFWTGVAATLVSTALARRASQVAALAESRGRLVAQTLDSEDHHRRELAEALHDDAIQNLLAARQELAPDRVDTADLTMVRHGLDRTVAQLRGAVFDLHPHLLEHAGLGPALIRNVARHPEAENLRVEVSREGDTTVLVVADDGRGFEHERLRAAPLTGHIGLASMAERVEAVGGTFTIEGGPGAGTRVAVRLPDEDADPPPAGVRPRRR